MLEVIAVHCVQLDAELWKTDTAIAIMITQNCLKLKLGKSDISSKERISEELVKLLQVRHVAIHAINGFILGCTQYHSMNKGNQPQHPTMGSNCNSAVLISITEFVLYASKNQNITYTESTSKTQGLCHCSNQKWNTPFPLQAVLLGCALNRKHEKHKAAGCCPWELWPLNESWFACSIF